MSTSVPSGRQPQRLSLDSVGMELRPILLTLAGGAVLMIVIVLLSFTESGSVTGLAAAVAAGLALMAATWLLPGMRLSPLPPEGRADPVGAARKLRSAGILAMALGEAPVLVGLMISFATNGWLPALGGGVIATSALLLFGPTKARLETWKARLEANGARTGL